MCIDESNINIFFKLGPKLPFAKQASTMITSPTEMGVVMIGGEGHLVLAPDVGHSMYAHIPLPDLLELSGNSIETLEWKILEKKLQYQRSYHVSFSISNDIAATLTTKSVGSSVQN